MGCIPYISKLENSRLHWFSIISIGISWMCMDFHGFKLMFIGFYEFMQFSFSGFQRTFIDFHGFHHIFMNCVDLGTQGQRPCGEPKKRAVPLHIEIWDSRLHSCRSVSLDAWVLQDCSGLEWVAAIWVDGTGGRSIIVPALTFTAPAKSAGVWQASLHNTCWISRCWDELQGDVCHPPIHNYGIHTSGGGQSPSL